MSYTLLIGCGVRYVDDTGGQCIKAAIREYLLGLLQRRTKVVWRSVAQDAHRLTAAIPDNVVILKGFVNQVLAPAKASEIIIFLPQGAIYGLYALFVAKLSGVKLAVYTGTDLQKQRGNKSNFHRPVLMVVQQFLLSRADLALVRGRSLANTVSVLNSNTRESPAIGNSVSDGIAWDIDRLDRDHFRIVYVGKITKGKGVLDLLLATSSVAEAHARVSLTLFGHGADLEEGISLAENVMDENPNIEIFFQGWVDEFAVIENELARSHCVVIPSKMAQPEGLPRVLEEAVAIGTPVVCSAHRSMADFSNERQVRGIEWLEDDSTAAISRALSAISGKFLNGALQPSRPKKFRYTAAAATAIKHLEWLAAGGQANHTAPRMSE